MTDEAQRIRAEYQRREREVPMEFYSVTRPANLFASQQKTRHLLRILGREGLLPLTGKSILDVGCGEGQHLLDLESWGARRVDLAGIDLIEERVARARARLCDASGASPGPDLRAGDASQLPWPDHRFDIVHQSTVFTSILDAEMKHAVAQEITRVLKPGGTLIWYDFLFSNPNNAHVRGVGAKEIRALFPDCTICLRRITLAPPIARRLVPLTWIGSLMLEKLRIVNTHYLALIGKANSSQ